jgi:hypothetical protein
MVPGQLRDSHSLKPMSAELLKGLAHSAITAAIIYNHYIICEICILAIPGFGGICMGL